MLSRTTVRTATLDDVTTIHDMANIVFRVTYREILSPEQMDYMMDWMYSPGSLSHQITDADKYFLIAECDGRPCGYVSFELEDKSDDSLPVYHLQKLYVMPDFHRKGLGRMLFNQVVSHLRDMGATPCRIELNVNRNNAAVSFYERIGMYRARQGDFPIGNGYYMNDYIYALDLA